MLWHEGDPLGWAQDTLSALQHELPFMRKRFFGSWRLVGGWQKRELPSRAPPFSPAPGLWVRLRRRRCVAEELLGLGRREHP